jgi:acyl-CoA thioesterase FadM
VDLAPATADVNLIFRLLWVVLAALGRSRLGPLDESVVRLRVLPSDLDLNLHMNNGRFLSLMDLGRVDLLVRTGLVGILRRMRWSAVVASVAVRYRRPLNPLRRYELRTRLLGWDERWVFLEQRFTRKGELMAYAVVKTQFFGAGGRVRPDEIVRAAQATLQSPPLPAAVREWMEAEDRLVAGESAAPAPL